MNEAYEIFSRESGEPETVFSGGTIKRAGDAYPKIKRGERVDINEIYHIKPARVYDDIDFSQLNSKLLK